jgi:hypothetical protein
MKRNTPLKTPISGSTGTNTPSITITNNTYVPPTVQDIVDKYQNQVKIRLYNRSQSETEPVAVLTHENVSPDQLKLYASFPFENTDDLFYDPEDGTDPQNLYFYGGDVKDVNFFPTYGINQGWFTIDGQNPFPLKLTVIDTRVRELDKLPKIANPKLNAKYVKFSDGLYDYSGVTKYLVSQPANAIITDGIKFNLEEHQLTIQSLQNLKFHDNGAPFIVHKINDFLSIYNHGFQIGFQIKCSTLQPGLDPKRLNQINVASKMFHCPKDTDGPSITANFEEWINWLLDRTGDSSYEKFFVDGFQDYTVSELDFIIIPFTNGSGGCAEDVVKHPAKLFLNKILIPQVKKNLCWFGCIVLAIKNPLNVPVWDSLNFNDQCQMLSDMVGHTENLPVFFDVMDQYAKTLNISYQIYYYKPLPEQQPNKWSKEIGLYQEYIGTGSLVKMLWVKRGKFGHFYQIIAESIFNYVSCAVCFEWFIKDSLSASKHAAACLACDKCKNKWTTNHKCRENRPRKYKSAKLFKKKKETPTYLKKNIHFADLETKSDIYGHQEVYSSAIVSCEVIQKFDTMNLDQNHVKCKEFLGHGGFERFIDYCLTLKNGHVWFYNGSRFDLYFIFQKAVERTDIEIVDFMKDEGSNKIISMKLQKGKLKVKFTDLCLFTLCSLEKACEAFQVPVNYIKKDFDHNLIKTWEDVEQHKHIIEEYNSFDVISMGIVYLNLAKPIWDEYKINICEYLSLSHLSYQIFLRKYCSDQIINTMKLPERMEYDFLKFGTFGGRSYCAIQYRESNFKKSDYYKNWDLLDDDIKKEAINIYKNCKTNLLYLDVVSLYPSVCYKDKFPCGGYIWLSPISFPKELSWLTLNTYRSHKELICRSYYEVDVKCPKDILIPFLLEKGSKGELVASLRDKIQQVYDGKTLIESLKLGYQITKIYNILRYGQFLPLFKEFMDDMFKKKNANPKGSVKYTLFKNIMNNNTGKHSQHIIPNVTKCFHNDKFLASMVDDDLKRIKKLQIFENGQDIIGYIASIENPNATPTKNTQLGVSILNNAKTFMSRLARKINAYHDPESSILYQDTDSMVISTKALDYLNDAQKKKYFGDNLGQLKNELPDALVHTLVCIAPKTYYLEYINLKTLKKEAVVRSKGCPQPKINLYYPVVKQYDAGFLPLSDLKQMELIEERRNTHPLPLNINDDLNWDLRDIHYTLVTRSGEIIRDSKYLDGDMFMSMIKNDNMVLCTFGRIDKRIIFNNKDTKNYSVVRILRDNVRTINKNNWWSNPMKRSMFYDTECPYSVPHGHQLNNF